MPLVQDNLYHLDPSMCAAGWERAEGEKSWHVDKYGTHYGTRTIQGRP